MRKSEMEGVEFKWTKKELNIVHGEERRLK